MISVTEENNGGNLRGDRVGRVRLIDFRNYAELDLQPGEGLNILFGPNAQGKTNFLEALYLLATTRLLRGSKDSEAVMDGASRAAVECVLAPSLSELSIVLEAGKRKVAHLNKLKLPRASDLLGRLPCVCISAFDMAIVRGSPEERRLFMDLEMSQGSPAYLNHLSHYKRSLDQRNALLRRAQESPVTAAEFEPWEIELATHGSPLRQQRRAMIEDVLQIASGIHRDMAEGESLHLQYEAKDPAETAGDLVRQFEESRARDIQRGSTSTGPHRDDLALIVGGRDARYFGSQGQQRTAVLSLKLATHHRRRASSGVAPLLLLDDVFSDLDESRRERLIDWLLQHARQAVLTCTEPQAAGKALLARATLWEVSAGKVASR